MSIIKEYGSCCRAGDLDRIRVIDSTGLIINIAELADAFASACLGNQIEVAKYLLKTHGAYIFTRPIVDRILPNCYFYGFVDMIEYLRSLVYDVKYRIEVRCLERACEGAHMDLVRSLVVKGVMCNKKTLLSACMSGRTRVIKYVLKCCDENMNRRAFKPGCTTRIGPKGLCEEDRRAFKHGCTTHRDPSDLYEEDTFDTLPIICKYGSVKAIRYLVDLDRGMDYPEGLAAACIRGDMNIIRYVYSEFVDDLCDEEMYNVFQRIYLKCSVEVIEYLLNTKRFDVNHCLLFWDSCEHNRIDVVKYFVSDQGVRALGINRGLLYCCMFEPSLEMVRYLIRELGAYLVDDDMREALVYCCRQGYTDIVECLVTHSRSHLGCTINAAFQAGCHHFSIVKYWLNAWRKHVFIHIGGCNAFKQALTHGNIDHIEYVRDLYDEEIDVTDWMPSIIANWHNQDTAIVKYIADHYDKFIDFDEGGSEAIQGCISNQRIETLTYLLDRYDPVLDVVSMVTRAFSSDQMRIAKVLIDRYASIIKPMIGKIYHDLQQRSDPFVLAMARKMLRL